jgi:hypothetical protein
VVKSSSENALQNSQEKKYGPFEEAFWQDGGRKRAISCAIREHAV